MNRLLPFLILAPALASARIGETLEQCSKRYGGVRELVQGRDWTSASYGASGLTVTCWFSGGQCTTIIFGLLEHSRVDLPALSERPQLSQEQAMRILEANRGESAWERRGGTEGAPLYKTADGKLHALVSSFGVSIQTVADIEARKALLTPEAIDKAIEGF